MACQHVWFYNTQQQFNPNLIISVYDIGVKSNLKDWNGKESDKQMENISDTKHIMSQKFNDLDLDMDQKHPTA